MADLTKYSKGKRMVSEDLIKILKNIKNNGIVKVTTSDIKSLTNDDINSLHCGDIVAKVTGNQKHAYIVSYKEEGQGICLTYADATYLETISYDYNDGSWVYNSQDSTVVASKDYVDSLMSGALKREIVETLPVEDIDTNTIYMVLNEEASTEGNVYDEYMYIDNSWELIGTTATTGVNLYLHNIVLRKDYSYTFITLNIINDSNSPIDTADKLKQYLIDKGFTQDSNGKAYNASGYAQAAGATVYNVLGIVYISNSSTFSFQAYDGTGFTYLTGNNIFGIIDDTVVTL